MPRQWVVWFSPSSDPRTRCLLVRCVCARVHRRLVTAAQEELRLAVQAFRAAQAAQKEAEESLPADMPDSQRWVRGVAPRCFASLLLHLCLGLCVCLLLRPEGPNPAADHFGLLATPLPLTGARWTSWPAPTPT